MRSRAWFEIHGYRRQVRMYNSGRLFAVQFPSDIEGQHAVVAEIRRTGRWAFVNGLGNTVSRKVQRVVVWAPEDDERFEP